MRVLWAQGVITEADVETALDHLFMVRMRLGHFDPNGALQQIPESVICSDEHATTAREGSTQGSTLLKNDAKTLPLSKSLGTVAVIGPNADLSKAIAGYYGSGDPCAAPLPSKTRFPSMVCEKSSPACA